MQRFLLTIVYGLVCFIPLMLLTIYFGTNSWWMDIVIVTFSLFIGSFLNTQFHGIHVMKAKHLGSAIGTNKFQVTLKIGGHGFINIVGTYTRIRPYEDLSLQTELYNAFNTFPASKLIKDFASDEAKKGLTFTIDDHGNQTQIDLEKYTQVLDKMQHE